jgi:multicomponent Na+:H+ antiporter subunit D
MAMCLASILCIFIGIFPNVLFSLLPYKVEYHVYTSSHVIGQLQLLIFAVLAFIFLIRFKLYPPEIPSTVLSFDWLYRVLLLRITLSVFKILRLIWDYFSNKFIQFVNYIFNLLQNSSNKADINPVTVGSSTVLILFSLGFVLICNYFLF